MTLLGVKTCGESEFDIFEAKKRFPNLGNAYFCWFSPRSLQEKLYIDAKAGGWRVYFEKIRVLNTGVSLE